MIRVEQIRLQITARTPTRMATRVSACRPSPSRLLVLADAPGRGVFGLAPTRARRRQQANAIQALREDRFYTVKLQRIF